MTSKKKVNLNDYELTTTLGTGIILQYNFTQNYIGSFGRVRLAKNKKTGEYFAMKILKKADIIKLKQVDHVISENTILADIDHPFLVQFYLII
jgi:serine/threonine protein kinase